MKDVVSCVHIVAKGSISKSHVVIWQTTSKNCIKVRAACEARLFFFSFNQSDYFLASWFLLKRPILFQRLRVLVLRREYCFALLMVNSLGRR